VGTTPTLDDEMSLRLARYVVELRILVLIRQVLIKGVGMGNPSQAQTTANADRLLLAYQKLPISLIGAVDLLEPFATTSFRQPDPNRLPEKALERLEEAFGRA
jgi:hypothetical protein